MILKYGSLAQIVILVGIISLWMSNVGKPWWYAPLAAMIAAVGILSTLYLGDSNAAFRKALTTASEFFFRDTVWAVATFIVLGIALALTGWQVYRTWPALTEYFSVTVFRELRLPGHFAVGSKVIILTQSDGESHIETVRNDGIARFERVIEKTNVSLQINEVRNGVLWAWGAPGFTLSSLPAQKDYDLAAIPNDKWGAVGIVDTSLPSLPRADQSVTSSSKQIGDTTFQALNAPWGIPDAPVIINRYAYIVGVDTDRRIPLWAAYALGTTELKVDRGKARFKPDPAIPLNMQSTNEDYRFAKREQNLNFDRGHLISPTDIRFKGPLAVAEAYYQTVLTPQTPALNRGIWNHLERATRDLAMKIERQIYVLDGPIFAEGQAVLTIGRNKIPVPTHFFRVMVWVSDDGSLRISSYLMPNDDEFRRDFQAFSTSIAKVEEQSGLVLLPLLITGLDDSQKLQVNPLPNP